MGSQASDARVQIFGAIDRVIHPRTLVGWVVRSNRRGGGEDLTLTVLLEGRTIGEGKPETFRPDIVDDQRYLCGFRIECSQDIPNWAIAFDKIKIEARDQEENSSILPIYDRERAIAINAELRAASPLGKYAIGIVILGLAESRAIPEELQKVLTDISEAAFSPQSSQTPMATTETTSHKDMIDNPRGLLTKFQSLGHNCFFGSVQRAYEAEPLGLLRFASINPDLLAKALETRLSGVGSPEFTRVIPDKNGEYFSSDIRFHMSAHTFVYERQVDFSRFYQRQCRKIAYLAENLLSEIAEASRILVLHAMPEVIPEATLKRIYEAVRKIGPADLLYLRPAQDGDVIGKVVVRSDNILEGCVLNPNAEMMSPNHVILESWLDACRQAWDLISTATQPKFEI